VGNGTLNSTSSGPIKSYKWEKVSGSCDIFGDLTSSSIRYNFTAPFPNCFIKLTVSNEFDSASITQRIEDI